MCSNLPKSRESPTRRAPDPHAMLAADRTGFSQPLRWPHLIVSGARPGPAWLR